MLPSELTLSATAENTIDLIIETANQLCKAIEHQDTDEGSKVKHSKQHMMQTSKSFSGEILEESPSMVPTTGGTGFERFKSVPLPKTSHPVYQIRMLERALQPFKRNLKYMQKLQSDVERELKEQLDLLLLVAKDVQQRSTTPAARIQKDLDDIIKKLTDLIMKVPVSLEKREKKKESRDQEQDGDNKGKRIVCLPGIHANEEVVKRLAVFRHVKEEFKKLSSTPHLQICLLSFAVFPENQEVNGTMLMYWWIGEGVLPIDVKPEVSVKNIFREFAEKKLIEPVGNKYKVEASSYMMDPFVHSSVVLISREIGLFDLYDKGRTTGMHESALNKVCLVKESSKQAKTMKGFSNIETVFNVSERFPDFTCRWFSSMKNLKVLCLGRWERSERDIQIHNRRVMKDLKFLKKLRLLSFQGISTIKSLSRSACKLTELIILDLRGCDNLEKLPDDIQKLKNLVYLDLTGCEALESIPERLSWLPRLEVLKGFVIREDETEITCSLKNLMRLLRLRKLSVIVDREDFGLDAMIEDIKGFKALEKLKVRWGTRTPLSKRKLEDRSKGRNISEEALCLPKQLRKLDLQRFPNTELPSWLEPQNLNDLEKLHLGSWTHLKGFGALPKKPTDCCVTVLRLTCLQKLKVEWRELTQLYFPRLNFLETYECPRVVFFPCDEDGIWRSDEWS